MREASPGEPEHSEDSPMEFRIANSPGPSLALADGVLGTMDVGTCVRRRRSAVDHDPNASMPKDVFLGMLAAAVTPTPGCGLGPASNRLVSAFLYVHRVDDVEPGLYYLDRGAFTLIPTRYGDERYPAKALSLGQDIASDACWAMSMVADFERGYRLFGERCYRYAHWEAGVIGQYLYLAATAAGFDATGIGAFFDDDVHRYLGLPDTYGVVYHFCVGKAVHDPRLTTLPAYPWNT